MRRLIFLLCLTSVICAGCFTPNKADKQLARVSKKYPGKLAEACKKSFPCIPVKRDTVKVDNTEYDFIELDCPEGGAVSYIKKTDTVVRIVTKTIIKKEKVDPIVKTVTVIQYLEDSANIYLIKKKADSLQAKLEKMHTKFENGKSLNIILLILLCIFLFLLWFRKSLFN